MDILKLQAAKLWNIQNVCKIYKFMKCLAGNCWARPPYSKVVWRYSAYMASDVTGSNVSSCTLLLLCSSPCFDSNSSGTVGFSSSTSTTQWQIACNHNTSSGVDGTGTTLATSTVKPERCDTLLAATRGVFWDYKIHIYLTWIEY